MSDGGSACLNIRGLVEFLNSILRMEAETWGDPVDAVLLRTIHLGEQEGRLYDVTSLASVTAMTVPTTARRVSDLIERGVINRYRDGRSYRLALTEESTQRLADSFERWVGKARGLFTEVEPPAVATEPPPATLSRAAM